MRKSLQNKNQLSVLKKNTRPLFVSDKNLKIVGINKKAEKLLGYESDELKGKDLNEILAEASKEEIKNLLDSFLNSVPSRERNTIQLELIKKDGVQFPIELHFSNVNDEMEGDFIFGNIKEVKIIKEKKEKEPELKLSKENYNDLFKYSPVPTFITRISDGKITGVNAKMQKLLGFTYNEILNKSVSKLKLIPNAKDSELLRKLIAENDSGENIELVISDKNKTIKNVLLSFEKIQLDNIAYIQSSIIDISLNKYLHKTIHDINSDINSYVNESKIKIDQVFHLEKELNKLTKRFITTASHEFRTPLATILSSLHLLKKHTTSENIHQIKHINKIKRAVSDLNNLINELLTLENVEEKSREQKESIINIETLMKQIIDETKPSLKENQKFYIHYSGKKLIRTNKDMLSVIINNLLSNAVKFSGKGQKIKIEESTDDKGIHIKVSDQGMGIPEDEQSLIFHPFFRSTITESILGKGIGLALIKKYLELINGKISFTSTIGKGTEFKVFIPATII